MKLFLFIITNLLVFFTYAGGKPQPHGPSAEQLKAMSLHNLGLAQQERSLGIIGKRSRSQVLPFAEYQTTGYVVFSDDDYYGAAEEIKNTIAKNLPSNTTLLVYTDSADKNYHKQLFNKYSQFLPANQLKILKVPATGSNNFWTRDNLPLPVWENNNFALVDARYYYNFEPDAFFQNLFGVNMASHKYFYEGGNFIANSKGDCIVVNRRKSYPGGVSDTAAIPDDVFESLYGCKNLIRFKHLKGIGHADEVVKFMSDNLIITDTKEYVATLEKAGFQVLLLPEANLNYETYINSLQVNDTVFVPIFGESNDQTVINAYKKFGLKVVPIDTQELATQGQGGIHCITMNYPPAPIKEMARFIGAEVVQ
jgi:hypothetical protein